MAIKYVPHPKLILLCDYSKGGFIAPEMIKKRPAIVISPRLPHRDNLCSVIPLSTKEPNRNLKYVVCLEFDQLLPSPFNHQTVWAKCDMVATVSLERLSLFQTKRDQTGKRRYIKPKLEEQDFARIKLAMHHAFGW